MPNAAGAGLLVCAGLTALVVVLASACGGQAPRSWDEQDLHEETRAIEGTKASAESLAPELCRVGIPGDLVPSPDPEPDDDPVPVTPPSDLVGSPITARPAPMVPIGPEIPAQTTTFDDPIPIKPQPVQPKGP